MEAVDTSKISAPTFWEKFKKSWAKTKAFIIKNYLPIAFLVALALALAWPVPGRYLANISILGNVRVVQVIPMMLVFFITGLQLNTSELKRALALRNLPVVLYGFVAILLITPCLGFALREVPLNPWEFASGLAIFCVAPTTLGVGVALTEACGGNRAMALLLTVGTNALAVFTMPPELNLLLGGNRGGGGLNVNVRVTDLLVKLAITVLVPFVVGKTLREVWSAAEAFAKAHRVPLSLFSTTALAFVVWQTLSAARDLLLQQRPGPVFAMIGLAVAMHLAYLLFNYLVVWFLLRATLREAIAVVIMASQKSAPVVVTTITFMTTDAAQQGLLSLPAIVGQLCQIFIGAGLARWLAKVVARSEQREAADTAAAKAAAAADGAADGSAALASPASKTDVEWNNPNGGGGEDGCRDGTRTDPARAPSPGSAASVAVAEAAATSGGLLAPGSRERPVTPEPSEVRRQRSPSATVDGTAPAAARLTQPIPGQPLS